MPTQKGCIVHVYNKASRNNPLFAEDEDYRVFVAYLSEYLSPFNADSFIKEFTVKGRTFKGKSHMPKNYFGKIEVIAFALMPDHFHLALSESSDRNIEQFMRSLSTRYSIYFNKKYKHSGSLFQGAYKSTNVDESSVGALVHYINDHKTKYSSLAEYQGKTKTAWLRQIENKNITKEILPSTLTLEDPVQVLERIPANNNLSSSRHYHQHIPAKISAKEKLRENRFPELLASLGIFLILFSLGLRNTVIYANDDKIFADILGVKTEETQILELPPTSIATPIPSQTPTSLTVPDTNQITVHLPDENSTINIRKYPSSSTEKVGVAMNGDSFEVLSKKAEWYEIKLPSGHSGFIPEEYVTLERKDL